MSVIISPVDLNPFSMNLLSDRLSDCEFIELCARNPNNRLERRSNGDIIIMPPGFTKTSARNAEISWQLKSWSRIDRKGVVSESSGGFLLPNTAIVAPDAAWTRKDRIAALGNREQEGFYALCPDFVIELRSTSDHLRELQEKMKEYLENGARLGWLIDADRRKVYIYRPGTPAETLENPEWLSGEDVLLGFRMEMAEIWEPDI